MPAKIRWSGAAGGENFLSVLSDQIATAKPASIGLAVAYSSTYGVRGLAKVLEKHHVGECRLVTDVCDCVTHPNALRLALNLGWRVRVVDNKSTFHPKLYIGCASFDEKDRPVSHSFSVVGSSNLSKAAFDSNVECFLTLPGPAQPPTASMTWAALWRLGANATTAVIDAYDKRFELRNKFRSTIDLTTLGVAETGLGSNIPSKEPTFSHNNATVVWVGLESFTGDYTFQLEFPIKAANVGRVLLGLPKGSTGVDMLCEDGAKRHFSFLFYTDNGMFRLNIPNDVPSAKWARQHKVGIGMIERAAPNDFRFTIVPPGPRLNDAVHRSQALGTWGTTPTRLYGWY
jgi:PLD-like domain